MLLVACLLPYVFLLLGLLTTQQTSGSKKVIHEVAFTQLSVIASDITILEYLVSHTTNLVTCFSFIGLDDGSCWTLHGNLILTCVSGDSCFVWKNVGDDRRLLYIGSYAETLAIEIHKSLKGSFFGLKWLL